jgi:hypothetical protein
MCWCTVSTIKLLMEEAGGDTDVMRYEPSQCDPPEKCSFMMALMPDCSPRSLSANSCIVFDPMTKERSAERFFFF